MASGSAVSAVGAAPDVCASIARALSARGQRAVHSLSGRGLQAELLTADAAREVLNEALVTGSGRNSDDPVSANEFRLPASRGQGRLWSCLDSRDVRHITYRLRRWPDGGLAVLQRELTGVPCYSVTTALTLTRTHDGHPATTVTVRVAFDQKIAWFTMDRRVHRAAAACRASLAPLHGEHVTGVLATLPLGREPSRRRLRRDGAEVRADIVPVTAGGVVIGTEPNGTPVSIPLFRGGRGTRVCIAGRPALSMLLALRALDAGARVQVATTRTAEWTQLRAQVGAGLELMTIVEPGSAPPVTGSRAAPWVVISDSGAAAGRRGAWQADVAAANSIPAVPGALHGLDALLFEQASPAEEPLVAAAFGLSADPGRQLIGSVPDGSVAVVLPGSARIILEPYRFAGSTSKWHHDLQGEKHGGHLRARNTPGIAGTKQERPQ